MSIKCYLYLLLGIVMYLFMGMLLGSCDSSIQAKSQNEGVVNPKDETFGSPKAEETFWDDYDFKNIALIHQPDITEQKIRQDT